MAFMDYMPQFGGNTTPMQETALPTDDAAMQLELKRRLKMAEALQQQAMPEGQMVSGHYVAPSWTQYLANAVNKYQGGKQEREALGQFGQYQTAKQDKITKLVNELSKGKTEPMDYNEAGNMPGMEQTTPFNQQEYMARVLQAMPELAPKFLEANLTNQFKEETPLVVGNNLVSKTGKVLYEAPEKANKIIGTPNPSDFTPKSLATYAQSGNYGDLELIPKAQTPRNIQIEKLREGNNEVTYQINADGTRTKIAQGPAFAPREDGQKPPSGYRFGPNGTLEAIKGGPADINNKPMKEIPPTARQAYSGNVASIAQIDAAIAAARKAPDDYFGLKGGLGNTYMSRMYPDSTDVRQKITGVSAAKRHELSGSAVTPSENAATAALLPQSTDDKATIVKKLEGLRDIYSSTNQAIAGSFGDEYKPLGQMQLAPTMPPNATPKLNTGKINESALKAGARYDLGNGQSGVWNPKTRTFE
jgi:hypothetical protein